jgi:uncharacterized repeat protein (TIGR03803 family)
MAKRSLNSAGIFMLAIVAVIMVAGPVWPSSYKVLHSFGPFPDAQSPEAGLVFDFAGNLYGTTFNGGTSDVGAVYELSPVQGGGWSAKVIYSFAGGADGGLPVATVVLDAKGHLYGTTESGGVGNGVVFELSPPSPGSTKWPETVIHTFTGGSDGVAPLGGVTFDGFGNLIGTTSVGGITNDGIIFELTPSGNGWSETMIHTFAGTNDDSIPVGKLVMDSRGRIYGTSRGGVGTVYRLSRNPSGRWLYQQLYCFCKGGGVSPYGGLAVDSSFRVYGTSYGGFGNGNVFELANPSPIQVKNLNGTTDGGGPLGGVVPDAMNHLWGTTSFGGGDHGLGVIFNAVHTGRTWTYKIEHLFAGGANSDGATPITDLILDAAGNLYGTTYSGGSVNGGVVFELTP